MTTPPGFDADRLKQMTDQVTQMAGRAREAGEALNKITVEVTSRDRAVTVHVGSGGILKSVRPGASASNVSPTNLCTSIMEAYAKAARQAAEQASALMEQVTGKDTRVMQMMRASMPVDPDEEERS